MLSDYKNYLIFIRNSLIRSGVELEVSDIQDYEEIFYFGERMGDLLWFFSILEISGSEDKLRGFVLPLNSFYAGSLRDKYFEEYLIYKAEYMKISASDTVIKDKLDKNKCVSNNNNFNTGDIEEDEFVNYDDEEAGENKNTDCNNEIESNDDEFIDYSSEDDEFIDYSNESVNEEITSNDDTSSDLDYEEDEFLNWGSTDDEYVEDDSSSEMEDEFLNWGSSDEDCCEQDSSQEEEEDAYNSWGSNEDDEENYDFGNWGSDESEIGIEEVIDEIDEDDEDEDSFSNWGNSSDDEDIPEENLNDYANTEEEEDTFSNWGSSDETDDIIYEEEEDSFSNWGNSDDENIDEEDTFSNWGSDENSDISDIDKSNDSNKKCNSSSSKKTKLDYEIESNDKTAKVIEKIALGIVNKGNLLKLKVSEKFKNNNEIKD